MQRWEHKCVQAVQSDKLQQWLDAMGEQGWELVAVTEIYGGDPDYADDYYTLFFKRPI